MIEFESPLHMDIAMARLNSWLEQEFSLLHEPFRFRVSSEKLHDSHYFEVRQRGNNLLPERVVTGNIRQLDERRSLVQCEVKTVGRYLSGFEAALVGIVGAAIFTTLSGEAITEYVILMWIIACVSTTCVIWLRRKLRKRHDPIIERIQYALKD